MKKRQLKLKEILKGLKEVSYVNPDSEFKKSMKEKLLKKFILNKNYEK